MIDHGERVLEVALERMFADPSEAEASSRAAAERILRAWRSGERGTGLEALGVDPDRAGEDLEPVGPDRASPAFTSEDRVPGQPGRVPRTVRVPRSEPGRGRSTALKIAAGLLALGGGAALWLWREAPPSGPHLVASRGVELHGGETGRRETGRADAPARGDVVRPGERVVVQGSDGVRFVRAGDRPGSDPGAGDGGGSWTLEAAPGSAFAWTPEGIRWESGGLRLEGASMPLRVELAAARVTLGPGAVFTADLQPPDGESAERDSRTLSLQLERGSGSNEYAAFEQDRASAERRELPADPEVWRAERVEPFEALRARLPVRVGPLRVAGPDIWLEQQAEFDRVSYELSDMLEEDPLLWEVMVERFVADRGAERRDLSPAFIDFLAWESSTRALDVAGRMWMVAPQSFDEEHLSAFACRGGFEFERELLALVEPGAIDSESGVLAAAYFARQGDDVGREQLRRYARVEAWRNPSAGMAKWTRTLIAAKALDWLGEPDPWSELGKHLRESVPEALERDPILYVGYSLAVADFVVTAGRDVLLRSPLDVRLAVHFRQLEPSLDSRRKVLDVLEDLLDRW